ncbi:MAG: radical SAM family heme chaperone HemW [Gammaproteobacteria bacterium]|nr:radical SAM family heme chaperone HemW [Gammaproteobacteria bacterium]
MSLPPLSLYVHIPWCERKCPYCDFNSHRSPDVLPQREYVAALLADLDQELPAVWGRRLRSVFIGGGTPSLFDASALGELLGGLRARLNLRPDVEITLEANPGSSEQQRFAAYREVGINRLSLGVQSFDDAALQALGRVHDAQQAHRAVEMARAAGFENLNLDLMYGLPGQTLERAVFDVEQALATRPAHLSYYQLTVEPNTLFHRYPPRLPGESAVAQIETTVLPRLASAGFSRYEVSAYAQPGRRSRHNMNYWQFGDYLGIGAGAHAKITCPQPRRIQRYSKQRQPKAYLRTAGTPQRIVSRYELADNDLVVEYILNALRLSDGFETADFSRLTGLAYPRIAARIEALCDEGLLSHDGARVTATPMGFRFLNDVVSRFDAGDDRHA